jgi:hemerythrin-like domain-containing protein
MSAETRPEGLRMYDELIAVHTIMRRGAELTVEALRRLAGGTALDVSALVRLARWQAEFVHHHHESEDEQFWPVLRGLFPETVAELDGLTVEHEHLDAGLTTLGEAIDALAGHKRDLTAAAEIAATQALPAAEKVRDVLISHLDTEEPILRDLFPRVPDDDIRRLRAAIVAGAPRTAPDLVFGLLEDPAPATGYGAMMQNLPRPLRWLRPVLLRRYRSVKHALETP